MVTISLDPFLIPATAGFTHQSTSWQLSKSRDFSIIENILDESLTDTTNLFEYRAGYSLEPGNVVFGRVKVHFSNGDETNWCRIITISNEQEGFTHSTTLVISPVVGVAASETNTPLGGFDITTNTFSLYSGLGKHLYTSWFIFDSDEKLIWSRLKDKDNLEKITVPENTLEDMRTYVVKAIHGTDTNSESNYGKRVVTTGDMTTKVFSFSGTQVLTDEDFNRYGINLYVNNFDTLNIILETLDGVEIANVLSSDTIISLNTAGLVIGRRYKLKARVTLTDGHTTPFTEIVLTCTKGVGGYQDATFVYDNKETLLNTSFINLDEQRSEQLPNGDILLVNDAGRLIVCRYENNKLIIVRTLDVYIPLVATSITCLDIRYFNIGKVLIGHVNSLYKIAFITFDYDIETSTVSNVTTTSTTGSIFISTEYINVINSTEIIYCSQYSGVMEKFNIVTNLITPLTPSGMTNTFGGILSSTGIDTLISIAGAVDIGIRSSNVVMKYTISTDTWATLTDLPVEIPVSFYFAHVFTRRDGILVFLDIKTNSDIDGIVLYDPLTDIWSIARNLTSDPVAYSTGASNIKLNDGGFITIIPNNDGSVTSLLT